MNISICKRCGHGVINSTTCNQCYLAPMPHKRVIRSGLGASVFTIGIMLLGVQTPPAEQSVVGEPAFLESSFSEKDNVRITMLEPKSAFIDAETVSFEAAFETE